MEPFLAVIVVVLLGVAGYLYLSRQSTAPTDAKRPPNGPTEVAKPSKPVAKKPVKHHHAHHHAPHSDAAKAKQVHLPDHALLSHVLKGHTGPITSACFSPNGRFIATASTDRTIRLTLRESLGSKNPTFKTINIPYDYATTCTFSCDGKTLGAVTADGQAVHMYSKFKAKPELTHTFPIHEHPQGVASLLLNDVGDDWTTVVTVGKDDDTDIRCWAVDGTLLQSTNLNQLQAYHGVQSKDNRFIAVASFTPEVKVQYMSKPRNPETPKPRTPWLCVNPGYIHS
ncbi:hypothetical protein DYB28_000500 [Aphanomyces astaci]|uniref:Uncharacterized protein n=1 Tax=Aphanomyces astaci TaxID=112090 RepID=A0A397FZ86_APHAT|nr:hypothetical protein DYB30_005865 [Aphanomyces astaci]RHZ41658.1 hypothetical protein DYB31_002119 [Aphanomyces astaci]RLO10582.1 hypothetical protein DYB28_000500 [Aphanomyces astaci]